MSDPVTMEIVDWRVADGLLEDAATHRWPVTVTQTATAYGGLSAIVKRADGVKTEVYLEREGDALRISVYQYTPDGDVDEEPRIRLSVATDGTVTAT